ncbi:unnamed protein product [Linum trigynum]|uniref:Replication protein A OB domain-containing protein n=1 Tax=Linum trigynum TaxID=586398 RepID=A0AAV2FG13_9ROSI
MWTFSPVSVVCTAAVGSLVDILGTVISVGRYKIIRSNRFQGRELSMRVVGAPAVRVFLWGNEFKQIGDSLEAIFNLGRHPTVSITQAKVSLHLQQKVAGTLTSSFVKIDPYASNASSSFDSNLGAITVMPNANRKTVLEIIGNLGKYLMAEYVTVEATISKFKDGP